MKILVTCLAIAFTTFTNAQTDQIKENVKIKNFAISVTVDSASDVKSIFKVKDFKTVLNTLKQDEDISFKITCSNNQNGYKSNVSYTVRGNSNNTSAFLKRVKKVRAAAIKYYQNKA